MAKSTYWERRVSRRGAVAGGVAAAVGLAAIGLAGCGDDSGATKSATAAGGTTVAAGSPAAASASPSAAAAAKPVPGGQLNLAVVARVRDFDPHRSLDYSSTGIGMVMDRALNADAAFKIQPALVKSWEIVGSGEAYVFRLQPNAKWHMKPPVNGRAVTAEDVAYSLMRIAAKLPGDKVAERPRSGSLPGMAKAEAIDPQTVRVTMSQPNASFLLGVTDYRNAIIPKELPDQLSFDDPSKAIGSGPFVIDKFDNSVQGVFVKNKEYWGTDTAGTQLPYLDRVQVDWLGDDASTMAAFLTKKVDYRLANTDEEKKTIKQARGDAQILKHPVGNRDQWRFNTRKKPFDDPRVWRALHLAFDYADLNDSYYGQGNWLYTGVLPSLYPAAIGSDEIKKMPGYNPDTKQKDIQDAKQLLAAAGYPDGKVSFSILTYPLEPYKSNAVNIQAQMKKVWPSMDIKIEIAADSATFNRSQSDGTFDTTSFAIVPPLDSVLTLTTQYSSDGSRNYGAYKNADVDAILQKALIEPKDDARNQLLLQAQKLILDTGNPTIWLNSQYYFHAYDPRFRGLQDLLNVSVGGSAGSGTAIVIADRTWVGKA